MKKIMLVMISVVMLFSACGNQTDNLVEESVQTQIDPAEEFNGVVFGMSKEEVIKALGKKPDYESEKFIEYNDKTFLDLNNATIYYYFSNYGKFDSISAHYSYSTDVKQEQVLNDYSTVKETLFKNYPPKTYGYYREEDDILSYSSINRSIYLSLHDHLISLDISDTEQTVPSQDDTAVT